MPETLPNFVTTNKVVAAVSILERMIAADADLSGHIVLIPQAGPGFDWLFGLKIGGFITMYGGANSHMTIRAAEFDLPAAIGVGETQYNTLCRAQVLELDCGARQIRTVR